MNEMRGEKNILSFAQNGGETMAVRAWKERKGWTRESKYTIVFVFLMTEKANIEISNIIMLLQLPL